MKMMHPGCNSDNHFGELNRMHLGQIHFELAVDYFIQIMTSRNGRP
jgi:hypothetical protein